MNYRKYVRGFILALSLFVCFNYLVWTLFTERLLTNRYGTGGDLARLGYIIDSKQARWAKVDLPKTHLKFNDYSGQRVDVLTIGDSFSIGGGEGRNNYFQDYIATISNASVLHLNMLVNDEGPLATAIVLLNSGYLDLIKPKVLLIESVERASVDRFGKEVDFAKTSSIDTIREFYSKPSNNFNYLEKTTFLNNANLKYVYCKIAYLFSDTPTKGVVVVRKKLSQSMFKVKNDRTLLFVYDDIKNIGRTFPDSVKKLNENFNRFSEELQKKDIRLYFMPAVDKYNLYSEYILNNPYPKSSFFEELRKLPKKYEFIDTKAILLAALRQGEKDIYYADDTHWSWRAPELIFNQVRFNR